MKSASRRQSGKGALDLIEEATHLLRTAPAALLAVYFLGTIPFVLGVLFFWADMSRSPFAHQHLAEASLGLAVLFLWMKLWQAVFARRVRAHLAAEPPPPLTPGRCARIFLAQTIVQPTALFIVPLAVIPALPFAWVYAFYQNATALADGESAGAPDLVRKAWKQAGLWPRQNHLILLILIGFAFCLFLTWTVGCFIAPHLVKMFTGIETLFTRNPFGMLNTTFFAAMFGLTYLCVDPILKVVYALRCFYGESLQSGEDLKAELKQFALAAGKLAAVAVMFAALGLPFSTKALDGPATEGPNLETPVADFRPSTPPPAGPASAPPASPSPSAISPPELDRAINDVIHGRKYAWRLPREKVVEDDSAKGPVARFLEKAMNLIRRWVKAALDWLEELIRRLFRQHRAGSDSGTGYGWIMALEILLYVLVAVAVGALLYALYRIWRGPRRATPVASEPIQPGPDLTAENLGAEQLPEDAWTKLARELLERGELRLALRAYYLASLAHLADRNLIRLARFKSNREYERELGRRGHSFPNLLAVFGENITVFERIWYGTHDVNLELVNGFARNVESMKAPP